VLLAGKNNGRGKIEPLRAGQAANPKSHEPDKFHKAATDQYKNLRPSLMAWRRIKLSLHARAAINRPIYGWSLS
jgi:hypothetical protein